MSGLSSAPSAARSPTSSLAASHPLCDTFDFWHIRHDPKRHYSELLQNVGSFSTVEEFWSVYSWLKRPSSLPSVSEYSVFRKGIQPQWEDPANLPGGRLCVKVKKLSNITTDRAWEALLLAFIGGRLEGGDNVCGVVVSVRPSNIQFSIWVRDKAAAASMRSAMVTHLMLGPDVTAHYKSHSDSIVADGSQEHYRSTALNLS